MDAIEEALHDGEFHEVILSTLPVHVSNWMRDDLPRWIAHPGLPVTTVTARLVPAGKQAFETIVRAAGDRPPA